MVPWPIDPKNGKVIWSWSSLHTSSFLYFLIGLMLIHNSYVFILCSNTVFFMQAYWYFCSMLLDVKIHWCSFLDLATALEFDAYMSVRFYLHMDKQCCNHSKDNNQFISGCYNFLMAYICNFYLDGLLKDYLLQTWEVNIICPAGNCYCCVLFSR